MALSHMFDPDDLPEILEYLASLGVRMPDDMLGQARKVVDRAINTDPLMQAKSALFDYFNERTNHSLFPKYDGANINFKPPYDGHPNIFKAPGNFETSLKPPSRNQDILDQLGNDLINQLGPKSTDFRQLDSGIQNEFKGLKNIWDKEYAPNSDGALRDAILNQRFNQSVLSKLKGLPPDQLDYRPYEEGYPREFIWSSYPRQFRNLASDMKYSKDPSVKQTFSDFADSYDDSKQLFDMIQGRTFASDSFPLRNFYKGEDLPPFQEDLFNDIPDVSPYPTNINNPTGVSPMLEQLLQQRLLQSQRLNSIRMPEDPVAEADRIIDDYLALERENGSDLLP